VQADVDDHARGAPQPVPQLREAHVVSLEEALLEHQLLAVEAPALAENRFLDEAAEHPRVLVRLERGDVMARIRFVHRDDRDPRPMMRTQTLAPLLRRQVLLDRRQHEFAEQLLVEGTDRRERAERR